MSNQNAKRPGIEFALFKCMREIGMDNFGSLNSAMYFISIFVTNLRKKFYGVRTLTVEPPQFPQYEPVCFKNYAQNEAGRLVTDFFLFSKYAQYELKASGLQLIFNIFR